MPTDYDMNLAMREENRMKPEIGRLHVITDTVLQHRYSHAELAELAIQGGADTIQYRSKSTDIRLLLREAEEVRTVCRRHDVLFLVNDRVDIALAIDADGVHLGRNDMPLLTARRLLGAGKIIGGTVRNAEHLRQAIEETADYVGLGPVFGTTSKAVDHDAVGLERVAEVSAISTIPVIAIAGITIENISDVLESGAYGIAVIGAVCCAEDVEVAARNLKLAIDAKR
jgi:thiamine-phosphate pyrophosphorylase